MKLEENLERITYHRNELEEIMSDNIFAKIYADEDKYKRISGDTPKEGKVPIHVQYAARHIKSKRFNFSGMVQAY